MRRSIEKSHESGVDVAPVAETIADEVPVSNQEAQDPTLAEDIKREDDLEDYAPAPNTSIPFSPQVVIDAITLKHNADIFLYSGDMTREGASQFVDNVEISKTRKNVVLILATYGGDADAAYMIARFLKRSFETFTLCVFGYCKSAGTLLALGADAIIMSCRGEFGPLDVQLVKPDEIGLRSSGLDIGQALDSLNATAFSFFERQFLQLKHRSYHAITTKTAGEIASSLAVGLLAPITSQIDPFKMGEMHRATNIAFHYGVRLDGDKSRVLRLIRDYPSHSFVIDYEEAKEIFRKVRMPDPMEQILEALLIQAMVEEQGCDCVRDPYDRGALIVHVNPPSDDNTSPKGDNDNTSPKGDNDNTSPKGDNDNMQREDETDDEPRNPQDDGGNNRSNHEAEDAGQGPAVSIPEKS